MTEPRRDLQLREHREVLEAIRRQLSETRRLHRKELEANRSLLTLLERLVPARPSPWRL